MQPRQIPLPGHGAIEPWGLCVHTTGDGLQRVSFVRLVNLKKSGSRKRKVKRMDKPDLSEENIKRLADIHIRRFSNRIELGNRGEPYIRVNECEHYLTIWKSIQEKKYSWDSLSEQERNEIEDAIYSGE